MRHAARAGAGGRGRGHGPGLWVYKRCGDRQFIKMSVQCNYCYRWISKKNISRHKKIHGTAPCLRCVGNGLSLAKPGIVATLGVNYWFQTFQYQLAASMIYDRMRQTVADECFKYLSHEIVEAHFEAALYHLGYPFMWEEPLKSTLHLIISRFIYDNIPFI